MAGVVSQISAEQLSALIRHPNPKMKTCGMPAFTGSNNDLRALIAYLQSFSVEFRISCASCAHRFTVLFSISNPLQASRSWRVPDVLSGS
jgi:hypothetical protein